MRQKFGFALLAASAVGLMGVPGAAFLALAALIF
jgi:hypothetical protein